MTEYPLPKPIEMLDDYMKQAYNALAVLFEVTQGLGRLSAQRPEIAPSLQQARINFENGFLWLQNAATGTAKIMSTQEKPRMELLKDEDDNGEKV